MFLIGRAAWEIALTNQKHYPDLKKKSQEIVHLHVTSYKLLNFRIIDFSWVTSLRQVGRLPTANGRYQISKQKSSGLWATSLVTFQQVLILKFALEHENLLVLSSNGSQVSAWLWNFQAGAVKKAENGVKTQGNKIKKE